MKFDWMSIVTTLVVVIVALVIYDRFVRAKVAVT